MSDRVFGLDIARASAIVLVVVSHVKFSFFGQTPAGIGFGVLGVEIFFALSGFLVGQIAIRDLVEDRSSLMHFCARRWFRTLPAYYVVLAILIILNRPDVFRIAENILFLQNLEIPNRYGILGVSWSLVVEEWFYILFPITLVLLRRLSSWSGEAIVWFVCFLGIVLCPSWRFFEASNGVSWEILRVQPIRMDALLFGVALAAWKIYRPDPYNALRKHRGAIFAAAVVGLSLVETAFFGAEFPNVGAVGVALMFSAISLLCATLIFALEVDLERTPVTIRAVVTAVSVISYSLYLVHEDLFHMIARHVGQGWKPTALGLVIASAAAMALFNLVERPSFWARARFSPRSRATSASYPAMQPGE